MKKVIILIIVCLLASGNSFAKLPKHKVTIAAISIVSNWVCWVMNNELLKKSKEKREKALHLSNVSNSYSIKSGFYSAFDYPYAVDNFFENANLAYLTRIESDKLYKEASSLKYTAGKYKSLQYVSIFTCIYYTISYIRAIREKNITKSKNVKLDLSHKKVILSYKF
jgi:hypothetical protein